MNRSGECFLTPAQSRTVRLGGHQEAVWLRETPEGRAVGQAGDGAGPGPVEALGPFLGLRIFLQG